VEVRCNFCSARYLFDSGDVEDLIGAMNVRSRKSRTSRNGELKKVER